MKYGYFTHFDNNGNTKFYYGEEGMISDFNFKNNLSRVTYPDRTLEQIKAAIQEEKITLIDNEERYIYFINLNTGEEEKVKRTTFEEAGMDIEEWG